jgi:hypothetical protein
MLRLAALLLMEEKMELSLVEMTALQSLALVPAMFKVRSVLLLLFVAVFALSPPLRSVEYSKAAAAAAAAAQQCSFRCRFALNAM